MPFFFSSTWTKITVSQSNIYWLVSFTNRFPPKPNCVLNFQKQGKATQTKLGGGAQV